MNNIWQKVGSWLFCSFTGLCTHVVFAHEILFPVSDMHHVAAFAVNIMWQKWYIVSENDPIMCSLHGNSGKIARLNILLQTQEGILNPTDNSSWSATHKTRLNTVKFDSEAYVAHKMCILGKTGYRNLYSWCFDVWGIWCSNTCCTFSGSQCVCVDLPGWEVETPPCDLADQPCCHLCQVVSWGWVKHWRNMLRS